MEIKGSNPLFFIYSLKLNTMLEETVELKLTWDEYSKLLSIVKYSLEVTQEYDLYNKVYTKRKITKLHKLQ